MSELIKQQTFIIAIMTFCGLTTCLVYDTFQYYIKTKVNNYVAAGLLQIICYVSIAFLIGDYLLYCDNGKISLEAMGAYVLGLWLWRKKICGIIVVKGEDDENDQEKRKTSRIRKRQQGNKHRRKSESQT